MQDVSIGLVMSVMPVITPIEKPIKRPGKSSLLLVVVATVGLLGAGWVWFAQGQQGVSLFSIGNKAVNGNAAATATDPSGALSGQNQRLMRDADRIRVGISDDRMTSWDYPKTTISATGPFRIQNKITGKVVYQGMPNELITVKRDEKGLWLSTTQGNLGPINGPAVFYPQLDTERLLIPSITRKGKVPQYRGVLEVLPIANSTQLLNVVNELPMQDYLKAVVPNELPISFGAEALKAQTVAARNYAIHPREKPWKTFDICDSQYCQVYFGAATEHRAATQAIQQTQGLVALYEGAPILALYSSSHGGVSESYENAFADTVSRQFPANPIPYLRAVPDSPLSMNLADETASRHFYTQTPVNIFSYDKVSPLFRWQTQWPVADLQRSLSVQLPKALADPALKAYVKAPPGYLALVQAPTSAATAAAAALPETRPFGQFTGLRVTRRGLSGKIMEMLIETDKGPWVITKESTVRKLFSYKGGMLPSANVVFETVFSDTPADGHMMKAIKAYGGGFGHGVGLSQYGAMAMAKLGCSFVDILQHYYQGVSLGTIPMVSDPNQPTQLAFYAPQSASYQLYIKPEGPAPFVMLPFQSDSSSTVVINNQPVVFKLTSEQLQTKTPLKIDVSSVIKPSRLNQLVLNATPHRRLKAWVELVPPRTAINQAPAHTK